VHYTVFLEDFLKGKLQMETEETPRTW